MLKPFQIEGAAFLAARTRALLADEPGVGKTGQVVAACDRVRAMSVLVVCPQIGMQHWHREFKRWKDGSCKGRLVAIVSFDSVRRNPDLYTKQRWEVLVVDECHFVKNPLAQRSHAVFAKGKLGWFADRIWCLSGTPAPNNAAELWPMLRAYGATRMDYETFKRYFCVVDDQGKVRGTRMDRKDELRAILKPYVLRRLKKDVLPELGEIDVQHWYVKPSTDYIRDGSLVWEAQAEEGRLREALAGKSFDEMLAFLAGDKEFSTLRRYNALLKTPAVFEQVMFEIENGLVDKIVIFGYHKEALDVLHQKFNAAGVGAILVFGDTPKDKRDALIEGWKRPTGPKVNLSSIIVAGTVLDYTAAHQVIALEMDWVPGNNWQAWQRPHRQGQTNPVTVRVAMGSEIDEIVNDVVLRKTKEIVAIFA